MAQTGVGCPVSSSSPSPCCMQMVNKSGQSPNHTAQQWRTNNGKSQLDTNLTECHAKNKLSRIGGHSISKTTFTIVLPRSFELPPGKTKKNIQTYPNPFNCIWRIAGSRFHNLFTSTPTNTKCAAHFCFPLQVTLPICWSMLQNQALVTPHPGISPKWFP